MRAAFFVLVVVGVAAAGAVRGGATTTPAPPSPAVPKWKPTYMMNESTIFMPCNYSGWFDPAFAAKFGELLTLPLA